MVIYDLMVYPVKKLTLCYSSELKYGYSEAFRCKFGVQYPAKSHGSKGGIAIPCAIQNDDLEDAKMLVANGCKLIAEASNMGLTQMQQSMH